LASTVLAALAAMAVISVSGVSMAQPPSNDDIDNATVVTALPFSEQISTVEATTAADDPDCAGNGPTVWYEFTPSENVRIRATTFGSDYDTTLSAYVGQRGGLTQVACNDDALGLQSRIDFEAAAGTTYFLMVGACCGGAGGSLVFNIDVAPPPPVLPTVQINRFGSFDRLTGSATISGTASCQQATFVELYVNVSQPAGRLFAQGSGSAFFPCSGTINWSATAQSYTPVLFVGGPAKVHLNGYAYTDPDFEFIGSLSSDEKVTLRRR
jgi:hypothetical protein